MKSRNNTKDIAFVSISILIITLLHYFTVSTKWDIHDFYRRLYYIPIIVSAFKFRLKGGVITSLVISLLYAPHLFLYFGKIDIAILNQFLEIIMFIVIGTITGFLVESDYRKKMLLEFQIKKLTDLENYTQNILDSITNVLIAVNKDLKIKSINKEGRDLFNVNNEFIGKSLHDLFIEYDKIEKILKDVFTFEKKVLEIETKCKTKDEKIIYVRLLAYPLININNKVEGIVIILEDISEIRKLESQIRRTEKLSAVGELASGIAHEIRNPMGIIKTISQIIYKEINDEELKEGISIIIHEINRANEVIKGLLDFAKPDIHQVKLQSIAQIIQDIILITKKYAQQHKVKINYDSDGDIKILLDSEKLKQAFVNIIFNSIQAMPDGGELNVNLKVTDKHVKISFEDTGIGIPKDKLEKIFDPFYTTKDKGTGLGLSITHRIIEEHSGHIEIESEIEKGTKIDIYLPIRQEEGDYNG